MCKELLNECSNGPNCVHKKRDGNPNARRDRFPNSTQRCRTAKNEGTQICSDYSKGLAPPDMRQVCADCPGGGQLQPLPTPPYDQVPQNPPAAAPAAGPSRIVGMPSNRAPLPPPQGTGMVTFSQAQQSLSGSTATQLISDQVYRPTPVLQGCAQPPCTTLSHYGLAQPDNFFKKSGKGDSLLDRYHQGLKAWPTLRLPLPYESYATYRVRVMGAAVGRNDANGIKNDYRRFWDNAHNRPYLPRNEYYEQMCEREISDRAALAAGRAPAPPLTFPWS